MRISLLAIFLLLCEQAYGQYVSSWYNMDNGLPQNSVKDIVKDKYGFIWLSTDSGIVRYDGLSFTTYNKLPVTDLHFGNFYGDISTDNIIIYNNYEENKILIKNRVVNVIKKSKSDRTYRKENNNFLKRITKNEIGIEYYSNTKYYIKTASGKYTFYNNEIVYTDGENKNKKIPILISGLFNVFLNKETLFITDPKNRKTYRIYKGNLTTFKKATLFNDPDSKIYWQQLTNQTFLINNNNIYLVQNYKNELQLKLLAAYENFGDQLFNIIFYDREFNTLYLGSVTKGLNILQLNQFYTAKKKIPFVDDSSNASLPFGKNTIIDPHGYEVNKYGLVKQHQFGVNDKHFMFYDQSGNIVYVNDNSIIRRYKSSEYRTMDTIRFPGLKGFFKSSNLYAISTTDLTYSYLHLFENQELKKINTSFRFIGYVNSFFKYTDDELLVGCTNGLYIVCLKNKKITHVAKGINVKNIVRTADGRIWITTNKDGLFLLKNKKLIKMPLDQNSYLSSAHYIVDDQYGYYWISSNNGLFRVSKKQLLQYATNNKVPVFYYRFTKSDGLLTNEFNGGSMPEAYSLKNGEFVFPSIEGFVFFNPKDIHAYYPDRNNIYVERIRINDADITYFKSHFVLENDYKYADVFIDIPYYSGFYNVRIEAKVQNEDTDWKPINIKNERKYTISNLGPGTYTLQLRVLVTPCGEYEYRSISFEIKPLFYQTSIFKVGVVILLLFIVTGVIHTRTKFLQIKNIALKRKVSSIKIELKESVQNLETVKNDMQKESEYQKKFVEAISHDITTPVKFIAMLSQQLTEVHDVNLQKEYFDSIHQSSEELYNFTMHLKEYSDLHRINNIYEKKEYVIKEVFIIKTKLFQEIAKSKKNSFSIEVEDGIYCHVNKNIMTCIIHNLIDNAVKYTSDGIIRLIAATGDGEIKIEICDTGQGMSQELISYYNKLYQMSDENDVIKFKITD
ncbi:two-component regulator propeller domain-containing protein [Chryseobacterium sp. DT-3]|uniref:ligand-binding sensor domain-containing protein n=1 Tax=Chryseobacterium sp. DT-3 TaxID=3396164 RepID=UPI003F1A8BA0